MTNDEYGQLVEFLGRKFEEVDRRFDRTATRDELQAQQTETRRHFDVVGEGLRSQMQLFAEGHQALVEGHQVLVEGQERILERVESLERELGAMIRISYAQLDDRVRNCERGLAAVQERLARVEARQT
jgi:hypothetical protein